MTLDTTNCLFECIGTIFAWMNAWYLFKDREIKGMYWPSSFYVAGFGIWSLYYYHNLSQWYSLSIAVIHVLGTLTWLILALFFHNKKETNEN